MLFRSFLQRLASASEIEVGEQFQISGCVQVITASAVAYIPMGELVDMEKELERLNKEKEACEKDIGFFSSKLQIENFVSRAPAQVVEAERAKLHKAQEKLQKVLDSLEALEKNR